MLDYTQFHEVFPPELQVPYEQGHVKEIERLRKGFNGVLFIDRVLKAMGIPAKGYPPKNENGLHTLHQQICQSKMSPHQKLSVLFYLLLDYDEVHAGRSQVSESFADNSGVPKRYQILMHGLWHMDRKHFSLALEYLAHPSLLPDFADDIVITLVRFGDTDEDTSHAIAYYQCVQPVLKTPEALELLLVAMTRFSVWEAFLFSRAHPAPTRQRLFQSMISTALSDKGFDTAKAGMELVALPFDQDEEVWFEEYLTKGDGRQLKKKAAATVLMRRIITDRVDDSIQAKALGSEWAIVTEALRTGSGGL